MTKIMGTLRNDKGTAIYETMMSLIATWDKQGLDTFEQMKPVSSTTGQRAEYIQRRVSKPRLIAGYVGR